MKTDDAIEEASSTDSTNESPEAETPPKEKENDEEFEKHFTIGEIIKSPIQFMFLVFSIFSALLLVPFTYKSYTAVVKWSKEAPEGYEYPKVTDFRVLIFSSLAFVLADKVMQIQFQKLFVNFIKDSDDAKLSKIRLKKAAANMSGGIQMLALTSFGFYILKDQFYMPKMLGGSGDYSEVFKNHPYAEHAPYLKQYYCVVTSYHLSSLIQHLCHTHENDFVEMAFHHSITIYLMFGSYMMNVWECGAVIAFLHDFTDCFGLFTKVFSQTTYDCFTMPLFFGVLTTWGYVRNIVFPIMIYQLWCSGIFKELEYVLPIYCYFLSCLVVLHYYWYSIFMQILYHFVSEGATDDLQNKIVKSEDNISQLEEVANLMNEIEKEKCD